MSVVQTGKSIMVVDDDPSVREVVARALGVKGYQVSTASNGIDALVAASKEHFDLMFLDIRMPGMSGLDVLDRMSRTHPNTVVVMLTATKGMFAQEEANKMEAYAYLTKPCKLGEITDVAETILRCSE